MPVAVYIGLTKKLLLLWLLCAMWVHYRPHSQRVAQFGTATLVLLAAWLLVLGVFVRPMDHDEVEHLHCAWLVSRGQVPFRDFWQHHSPMIYLAFAPLMRLPIDPIYTPIAARLIGAGLTLGVAIIGWKMARAVWGDDVRPRTYVFMWIVILPLIELFTPRPDLPATLLVFAGLALVIMTGEYTKLRYFAGGLLQGLGLSFSPKLYLLLLAPVIASFWFHRLHAIPRLAAFGLGVLGGVVPLAAYLVHHDLVDAFRDWVITFNWKQQVPQGFRFHPVLLGLGVVGAWQLAKRYSRFNAEQRLLFLLAYCFTGIASLQNPLLYLFYYAAPWMILTAVTVSSIDIPQLLDKASRSRMQLAVASLGLALLFYPALLTIIGNRSAAEQPTANWSTWTKLYRLNRNETCVALAPFHPIFADDAIGLYGGWQSTFAYLNPTLRDDLASRDVPDSIRRHRPATITGCTDNENQHILDYLLDIGAIDRKEQEYLRQYLARHYTQVQLGRPTYVRNDLLTLARAEGIDVPRDVHVMARGLNDELCRDRPAGCVHSLKTS